jgi:hypothetical protein
MNINKLNVVSSYCSFCANIYQQAQKHAPRCPGFLSTTTTSQSYCPNKNNVYFSAPYGFDLNVLADIDPNSPTFERILIKDRLINDYGNVLLKDLCQICHNQKLQYGREIHEAKIQKINWLNSLPEVFCGNKDRKGCQLMTRYYQNDNNGIRYGNYYCSKCRVEYNGLEYKHNNDGKQRQLQLYSQQSQFDFNNNNNNHSGEKQERLCKNNKFGCLNKTNEHPYCKECYNKWLLSNSLKQK